MPSVSGGELVSVIWPLGEVVFLLGGVVSVVSVLGVVSVVSVLGVVSVVSVL